MKMIRLRKVSLETHTGSFDDSPKVATALKDEISCKETSMVEHPQKEVCEQNLLKSTNTFPE